MVILQRQEQDPTKRDTKPLVLYDDFEGNTENEINNFDENAIRSPRVHLDHRMMDDDRYYKTSKSTKTFHEVSSMQIDHLRQRQDNK